MARAEWRLWSDDLDDVALTQMSLAYVRRKRFEAQLVATQVGRLFAGGGNAERSDRISSDEMLKLMGIS